MDEEVIIWIVERPSQNPDWNLIELLWEEMDRRDKLKKPTSVPGLERIVGKIGMNFFLKFCAGSL